MRLFKKIVFVIISATFFSGCFITHKGSISSGPLLNVNDRYVDIARGEAQSLIVLGIGAIDNDALLLDAKKNLFTNRPLLKNEYYANFTADISRKYIFFPIVAINKVTLSAEVLRAGDTSNTALSNTFKDVIRLNSEKLFFEIGIDTFKVNDQVYFTNLYDDFIKTKDLNRYKIIAINKNEVNLKPVFSSNENEVVKISTSNFFSTTKNLKDFKIGDKVKAQVYDIYIASSKFENGEIIASQNGYALVKTFSGSYKLAPNKLKLLNYTDSVAIKTNNLKKEIVNGDSVYYYSANNKKYNLYIVSEINSENVMLKSVEPNTKNILTTIKDNKFFKKDFNIQGLKYNDKVLIIVDSSNNFNVIEIEGILLGIYDDKVLVKTTGGQFYEAESKKVKKIN